jgi:predicted secreted protein
MKLTRPLDATVARPGNGAEAAFAAGYKGLPSSYKRSFPDAYKAGQEAARDERKKAESGDNHLLTRPLAATLASPGNPSESAFAAGYKGLPSSYKKSCPDAYKAGQKAAREERQEAAITQEGATS